MEGGSLNSELHKYFNYDLNQITRSGFIKQRNKLKPDTMEYLFHKFHEQILCNKKYQGYQLLACDGSDLNIFRDPLNPHTYFAGKELLVLINCILMPCMTSKAGDMSML